MKKIYVLGTMLVLLMVMSIIPSSISVVSANNTKCVIAPASNELKEYQDFSGITSFADVTVYDDFGIMQSSSSEAYLNAAITRYTVLLLDTSGEKWILTGGTAGNIQIGASFDKVQKAALNFVKQVMYAPGKNYVAVVGFDKDVKEQGKFYDTLAPLEEAIDKLQVAENWVNTNAALIEAGRLLDDVDDPDTVKNVICFSGWMPSEGKYDLTGPYELWRDYPYVRYGDGLHIVGFCNPAYKTAESLRGKGYNIYMLACFNNLDKHEPTFNFTQRIMEDLAGNINRVHTVENPDDLYFLFGDVIEDIWGAIWWQEYADKTKTIWRNWGGFAYNMEGKPYKKGHLGLDLIQPEDKSPFDDKDVVAVHRGNVLFAGYDSANGNVVLIEHEVDGITFYSFYAHLRSPVFTGGKQTPPIPVYSGQKLGLMGWSGDEQTGPHLHIGIYRLLAGSYVNGGQPGWLYKDFSKENPGFYELKDDGNYGRTWRWGKLEFLFYDPIAVITNTSSLVKLANYNKVINIACPVDVDVYDSQNILVSRIVNGEVIVNGLPTSVIGDIKRVYLAQGDDYRIEIIATDDGVMKYSITERDNKLVTTRKVMMNDVPLTKGEMFTSYVNTEKDAPSETYVLTSSNGQKYYADEDLTDSDVNNIIITASVIGGGEVSDSILKETKGDYTAISAFTDDDVDWEFEGWYENGVKIEGAGSTYRFYATEDRELVAMFVHKERPTRNIILWADTGGSVSGDGVFDKDSVITIKAIPDVGYVFEGWYEVNRYGDYIKVSDDVMYSITLTESMKFVARFKQNPFGINIRDISVGNKQANIDFDIVSPSGKGYSVYLSLSEEEGTFKLYVDVNYNSKGVHIKGLTNGETYYVYIAYSDAGAVLRSNVIKFTVNQ